MRLFKLRPLLSLILSLTPAALAAFSPRLIGPLHAQALSASHPQLISAEVIAQLTAGGPDWIELRDTADAELTSLARPGYAGWGWRGTLENYALAYQVASRIGDQDRARAYGKKALGLMKVLARHHNYGGPFDDMFPDLPSQVLGQGNGVQTSFPLPMAPMPGAPLWVVKTPVEVLSVGRTGASDDLGAFSPILKVSNTPNGPANYQPSDYALHYRDGYGVFRLHWITANQPPLGATYYVTQVQGTSGRVVAGNEYTLQGSAIVFSVPPSSGEAVSVHFLSVDYEQTGNGLGGLNAVQPDGPGYPMRTFNVGLAYGFDLIFDFADFSPPLKSEFVDVLNTEIDWYASEGYDHNGALGNYFIEGFLTGTLNTAYGTDGANPRAQEWKALAAALVQRTYDALTYALPGGYGPEGQYTNGTVRDILQTFTTYRRVTGQNPLASLEWTSNLIPCIIHGTKPDRVSFYDGGDWDDLPATPPTSAVWYFLNFLPDHPMASYARQYLQDLGNAPEGQLRDYKIDFPPAFLAKVSGPLYARSDWEMGAVWISLAAEQIVSGHQHRDQGHISIQRGADYLLVDAGSYGYSSTRYHNTLLFDDRGAGDISTYPPDQGWWGDETVRIQKFEQAADYVYGQADYTASYNRAFGNEGNSVKTALRSIVFIRPDVVVVHDQAQTLDPRVRKIFNVNFATPPARTGAIFQSDRGQSRLFMKSLVPNNPDPTIEPLNGAFNYQQVSVGSTEDTFLHVFLATSQAQSTMVPATHIATTNGLMQGAEVAIGGKTWASLFAARDKQITQPIQYTVASPGPHRHLLTDLRQSAQHRVLVTSGGQTLQDAILTSSPEGTLLFSFNTAAAAHISVTPLGTGPLLGDLDHNGRLDAVDLVLLQNLIATGQFDPQGDMDQNGRLDAIDLVLLQNAIATQP